MRPETGLAKAAGLELGPRGGIHVDEGMRTSDPAIWAVGDAVEVKVSSLAAALPAGGFLAVLMMSGWCEGCSVLGTQAHRGALPLCLPHAPVPCRTGSRSSPR